MTVAPAGRKPARLIGMISIVRRLGLIVILTTAATTALSGQPSLTANGTEFVLTTADARTLKWAELQGATLRIALNERLAEVTIEHVEDDPRAVGGRVLLHHFVVRESSGRGTDLCAPAAEGRSLGFPVQTAAVTRL